MNLDELCNATLPIIEDFNATRSEKLRAAWAWIEGVYTIRRAAQLLVDMIGEARYRLCPELGRISDEAKVVRMQVAYLNHLDLLDPTNETPLHVVSHILPESLKDLLSEMYVRSRLAA
jgi:hypothetical protein